MSRSPLAGVALALCPLLSLLVEPGAAPAQEPFVEPEQEPSPPPVDVYGRPHPDGLEAILEKMQGAWRLVEIVDDALPAEGRLEVGYLLVSAHFLAIEVHMTWEDTDGEPLEDAFQSGIHEFTFDGPDRLVAASLIGSYLDDEEELEWEVPTSVREFQVHVADTALTLLRDDGSYLVFERHHGDQARERNLFGTRPGEESLFGTPPARDDAAEPAPADGDGDNSEDGGDG